MLAENSKYLKESKNYSVTEEGVRSVDSNDEAVNHPTHYTWHPSGVECKDIVQEFDYNIGVAIGYLWRYKFKNGIQDLKKAVQHITFEIERLERINHED